jgi:hypothetical protein
MVEVQQNMRSLTFVAGVRVTGYAWALRAFFSKHPKAAGLLLGVVVLLACGAVLVLWEMGHECIRRSTRYDVSEYGRVYTTKVCAETRPRWGENIGK